ncbi:hypothetical protein ACJMK2_029081 [Sinanodonta woodiana]|uniref:Uncharacterized protein n=1 Tax=Sinanodonta woodiana TaxID=1069815 RepID=A0ABD3X928_SINWO
MSLSKNFRCRHSLIGLLLYVPLLHRVCSDTRWLPFQNHEGKDVNVSKLISVAKSTLGVESFCNTSNGRDSARLSTLCTCAKNCANVRTCCPDNPYSYLKQSCLNIALYRPEGSYQVGRRMVDVCLYHENHSLPICRKEIERSIFDVPVSSKRTQLSYVHRLCALCSLETDNDLKQWEPVVAKCVSSHSEIEGGQTNTTLLKQLVSEGECILVHNELVLYDRNCIPSVVNEIVEGIIDSCNTTGLWDRYDPDIDWACIHHTTQFEQFANVFCYICNPDIVSHSSRPLIDTCNVTGYWKRNEINIEQGCLHSNSESRFHPFKNAFCYMCNIWDSSFSSYISQHQLPEIQTNSINVLVVEKYDQETSVFLTQIYLYEGDVVSDYPPNKVVDEFRQECNQVCLRNYKRGTVDYKMCTECQCSTMKVCEKNHERNEMFYCVPDTFKSSGHHENFFLVLGVCLSPNVSNEIKQKCEEPDQVNIIDNVPVFVKGDVIMFRNRYCSKCNGYNTISFLDIEISCGVYIDARLTQSFENLIQLSVQNSCKIKYVRNDCNDLNVMKPLYTQPISACNTTGHWTFEGGAQDILYACEQDLSRVSKTLNLRSLPTLDEPFHEFKNIYCYVCNPYNTYPLYTKCNMSELWETHDAQVESDCKNGPKESKWGPFKNFDCFKCNNRVDTSIEVHIVKDLIDIIVHESYRYIFDISPKTFDELARIYADPTEFHQKSEQNLIFEDTYCPKGKIMMNGSCDYLTESPGTISRYGVYYSVTLSEDRMETLNHVWSEEIRIECCARLFLILSPQQQHI